MRGSNVIIRTGVFEKYESWGFYVLMYFLAMLNSCSGLVLSCLSVAISPCYLPCRGSIRPFPVPEHRHRPWDSWAAW